MSDVVVRVEGLGKEYRLGGRPAYSTLGEQLRNWSPLRGLLGRGRADAPPPFWALKDVSFEVKRGEVVGIIGRNGAGKSTLLKILSRITEPTEGGADIHGRVGSLLEVGTGFHPELTGRENVYLNGAILGMRRSEVRTKFDDIVGFAEVEKFIDTPVKHYSSGMYTRLAFAVAAHLEPEILIVDEVLAVGDAQFQQKCLGKMGEVARGGRTVLFVSHNMTAVGGLCDTTVLLKSGSVAFLGSTAEALGLYLNEASEGRSAWSDKSGILREAQLLEIEESPPHGVFINLRFVLDVPHAGLGLDLLIRFGLHPVHFLSSAYLGTTELSEGTRTVRCRIGPVNMALGQYTIDARVCEPMKRWVEERDAVLSFGVERQYGVQRNFELRAARELGFVIPCQQWVLES